MKSATNKTIAENPWPELPLNQWEETYTLLHLWSQIIGKIKLELTPFTNHWWNITFFPSATGLTTGLIPYENIFFEMEFNFISHQLIIKTDEGKKASIALRSGTVAEFYYEVKEKLKSMGIEIHIWTVPVEIEDRLPFDLDHRPRKYDPEYANRFWKCLLLISNVMKVFRSDFTGKASPVHFFWGSFDLALTFFSGRSAPEHPGAPNVGKKVMIASYNAELASFGFWPGKGLGEAAFYAYTYPEPDGFKNHKIEPDTAYYNETIREFFLPYREVQHAEFPEKIILDFYRSTYQAASETGQWNKSLYKNTL